MECEISYSLHEQEKRFHESVYFIRKYKGKVSRNLKQFRILSPILTSRLWYLRSLVLGSLLC